MEVEEMAANQVDTEQAAAAGYKKIAAAEKAVAEEAAGAEEAAAAKGAAAEGKTAAEEEATDSSDEMEGLDADFGQTHVVSTSMVPEDERKAVEAADADSTILGRLVEC